MLPNVLSKVLPGMQADSKMHALSPNTSGPPAVTPGVTVEQAAGADTPMTTNTGCKINDDFNTLRAGPRGPGLLEDFHFREKMTHFDHERIPERVVHARGSGAHGEFRVYDDSLKQFTRAKFLTDPSLTTKTFVRFSTAIGNRGSTDLARDVRGFATRFYTVEGNVDLVGNNIPVFFIQDAIKFPDLFHAAKPEPHDEIPQAQTAHDTFWDFISLMPESAHMIMWAMSDRGIPRSYRTMEGFGVNTFRLVNEAGKAVFVKFHWKPLQGAHAVLWDEALEISGKDPDFHRRDLWEAIENKCFPEWELGVQIVEEADEHKFPFDLLDATKLIPESMVPVRRVGKMTLNRNPDNFFCETEQVAFHLSNIVPGIDFSDDPLLHGRLFSYLDTQLLRLGGPNFTEIPINRPVVPVHNNQRDSFHRQTINKGMTSYSPNSLGGGCPFQASLAQGGFMSFPSRVTETKVRNRPKDKFFDHFSQANLFWRSQTPVEQKHIVRAFTFELGRCSRVNIRQRMIGILERIDQGLAQQVADGLGLTVQKLEPPINHGVPADVDRFEWEPRPLDTKSYPDDPSLSMLRQLKPGQGLAGRKVAILAADGFSAADALEMKAALLASSVLGLVVAPRAGYIHAESTTGSISSAAATAAGASSSTSPKSAASTSSAIALPVDFSLLTASAVIFDAIYIPGGRQSVKTLSNDPDARYFVAQFFKHCKVVGAVGAGLEMVAGLPLDDGVLLESSGFGLKYSAKFLAAMGLHRVWDREMTGRNQQYHRIMSPPTMTQGGSVSMGQAPPGTAASGTSASAAAGSISRGTLSVRVLRASELKDASWVSQSPFVVLSIDDGKIEQQGMPIGGGGTEPIFDQLFLIPLEGSEKTMRVTIKHSGTLTSTEIGSVNVPLHALLKAPRPTRLELLNGAGVVFVDAQFAAC